MEVLTRYFELRDASGEPMEWGVNRFPDGQIQFWTKNRTENAVGGSLTLAIANSECLDLFFQIVNALALARVRISYLYGARSDKRVAGDRIVAHLPSTFFSAIQHMKSGQDYDTKYEVLAPHCHEFMKHSRLAYVKSVYPWPPLMLRNYQHVLFPDRSAYERYRSSEDVGDLDYYVCEKERDQVTGEITKHTMPRLGPKDRSILVVDDLCDGGRTFTDIGQACRASATLEKLDLYVTHGVFSNGAVDRLLDFYNDIYVTDSLPTVRDIQNPRVHVFSAWGEK